MNFVEPLVKQLEGMWIGFVKLLPLLVIAVIFLLLTWLFIRVVSKVIEKMLSRNRIRPSLKSLAVTVFKTTAWLVGIMSAATIVFPSLTPAKMLAGLGLGSVAVGFAFKDIFENFLAGILIMLRDPMRIGDFIDCDGVEGKIEKITVRDTYVRQTNDELLLVPNAHLFKNPVQIVTDKAIRRYEIIAGVGYGESVDDCRELIKQAVEELTDIAPNKPVEVYACEFGDSSVNFTVRWWAGSKPIDLHKTRDKVIAAIKRKLDENGVEIPFPYRTLTFADTLSIETKSDQPQAS